MPVATVDHVCGDGYAGGCESSSGNLAECRADGDAALSDRSGCGLSFCLDERPHGSQHPSRSFSSSLSAPTAFPLVLPAKRDLSRETLDEIVR